MITRVPDIVVTLAMSFVWAGATLLVLDSPGGGAADWFKGLISGSIGSEWVPRALVVLVVAVGVVWIPLRRSIARAVAVRDRQRSAGGVPERRLGRADEDHRVLR